MLKKGKTSALTAIITEEKKSSTKFWWKTQGDWYWEFKTVFDHSEKNAYRKHEWTVYNNRNIKYLFYQDYYKHRYGQAKSCEEFKIAKY